MSNTKDKGRSVGSQATLEHHTTLHPHHSTHKGLIKGRHRPALQANRPFRRRAKFRRDLLPDPEVYYAAQDIKLTGCGAWRDALCPFHGDKKPSLRVKVETGAFSCMACGVRGGDVLAFHMQLHGLSFIDAAKALGAWEESR